MMEGRSEDVGVQLLSCRRLISLSGLVTESLTSAVPGKSSLNVKWCMDLIPLRAFCLNGLSKNFAQSYVGTSTRPSCVPTGWAWFTTAEVSTTLTMSSRQLILVRRYACFNRPKHQSGENLVCPTIRNDNVIFLLRPTKTRQARYCMTKRFLFCPEQLSTWR